MADDKGNDNKKSLKIKPAQKLVVPIDKMAQIIFESNSQFPDLDIVECKKPEIVTNLKVEYCGFDGLNEFDKAIFNACVSEQFNGNHYTTLAILHRAIGGSKKKFSSKDKDKILETVKKLGKITVQIDMTDACKKYNYNNGRAYKYCGSLLPCEFMIASVNGHTDEATIHFLRETPLFEIAQMKKQFATVDNSLLYIEGTRNTDTVLKIKNYLLRRVIEIKGSNSRKNKRVKKLQKIILLEKLYQQCELSDVSRNRKGEYRKIITKTLDHFKNKKFIRNWNFEEKDRAIYSIKIDF